MHFSRQFRLWRREVRPTLTLALPIMAGMVSQMLMGLADTIMVGRVGVIPLAAASFVNAVAHLPLVLGIGLLSAVSVLTAQAYGAKRPDEAGETLRHGLVLAVGLGLFSLLVLAALYPLLDHFGQSPEVVTAARPYLLLFGLSLLPALVAQSCRQFAEALKNPWMPTFVMLGGVLLNVWLNWIFIYGHWGAPALGLVGAGWATVIARFVMMLVLIAYVMRAPALKAFQPARWWVALRGEYLQRLFHIGWPVGMQHLFEVSAFVLAAIMMGWISADAIAAHQIAISCAAFTFMFALGIGAAACIRVGHAFGAGQFSRMQRIGFCAIGLAALLMSCFGVAFMVAGRPIASLFIDSPAVVGLTAQLLVVAAVFQMVDGIQVTSLSALRGLADVRVPAVIAVVAYWVVALPIGWALAFRTSLGAVGMWIGLAAGLGAAAVGLCWRFYRLTISSPRRPPAEPPLVETFPEHGSLP